MKKVLISIISVLLPMCIYAQQKTVNVSEAGTLSTLINASERASINSLKVTGTLNGNDVKVLREMGKSALAELDMSEAKIVKGGDSYYPIGADRSAYTEDDRLSTLFFYGCNALRSVTIPNSVKSVSNDAFSSCPNLAEIKVVNSPFFVSVDGILFNAEKERLIRCPQAKKLESYEVPRGVIEIYPSAFRGNTSLKSITFPRSIWSISDMSFYGCTNLQTIRCKMTRVASLAEAFDASTMSTAKVYVPKEALEDYKSVNIWNRFKNFIGEEE